MTSKDFFLEHYKAFKTKYFDESSIRILQKVGPLHKWLATTLKSQDPNGTIIDYGCGTGELVYELQRELPTHRIIGFDINHLLIHDAQTRFPIVAKQLTASIDEYTGQGTKSIDTIIFNFSLMFMAPFETNLADLLRTLKPGTKVVVINPFPGARSNFQKNLDNEFHGFLIRARRSSEQELLKEKLDSCMEERAFDPQEAEKLFSNYGFKCEQIIHDFEIKRYPTVV